jgi:oligopeptidase A
MDNPLLNTWGLPAFAHIDASHVEPALDAVLEDNRAAIRALVDSPGPATWATRLAPLEAIADRLHKVWSPVRHLHGVADSEALRLAYSAGLGKLSDYHTELGQHQGLYRAYRAVKDGGEYPGLGPAERKIIDNALRDFRLSGIELTGPDRERYREMRQRLTRLEAGFEEHLLDATQAWKRHLTDPAALAGLPETALGLARQMAERAGLPGFLLTLDHPCYAPVITYAEDHELRREMYQAYMTRASDQGPDAGRFDNTATMVEILALRRDLARLLGFRDFAEYSLVPRMARDPEEVLSFLGDLAARARPLALEELEALSSYARDEHGAGPVAAWDIPYYSEKLRQARYNVSQEALRPYFPVPKVLEGLFTVAKKLYGIAIRPQEQVEVWHPDVKFFAIHDPDGSPRGSFYLDLYARAHKRGGAWMDECIVRRRAPEGVQFPVAYLNCNFTPPIGTPPIGDRPSLLTHGEVVTLFHEFGHGLHHLLTRVDYPSIAGINGVPWDAVELPSQFMENWCWEREALDVISGHHETGAPLPPELLDRMQSARNFQSGMQMVRQIELALFDFRLHRLSGPIDGAAIQAVLDTVREEVAVVEPPAYTRFQHGFAHIFAGGYAAGYYSYKWAEVLAADAYSKFEERGVFDRATGAEFLHTVLEQGGSRDPMDLFVAFRGRRPSIEPLMRHLGLAA